VCVWGAQPITVHALHLWAALESQQQLKEDLRPLCARSQGQDRDGADSALFPQVSRRGTHILGPSHLLFLPA
jgi:hypothetical protein